MAIDLVFFDEIPSEPDLEFLDVKMVAKNKWDKKTFQVTEIVAVKSGKGYLLKTSHFQVFIWKNSTVAKFLVEALLHWVKEGNGKALYVQCINSKNECFRIASSKGEECIWYSNGKKYSISPLLDIPEESETVNPFM